MFPYGRWPTNSSHICAAMHTNTVSQRRQAAPLQQSPVRMHSSNEPINGATVAVTLTKERQPPTDDQLLSLTIACTLHALCKCLTKWPEKLPGCCIWRKAPRRHCGPALMSNRGCPHTQHGTVTPTITPNAYTSTDALTCTATHLAQQSDA
jgi:hypothetical protein